MCLYRGHSVGTPFGKGEGVKKATEWHRKEGVQPKKWCPSHKFFYVLISITQSLFLLCFLWSFDNITANNNKSTFKIKPRNNYLIFAQKYYNSTTSSMWVVYTNMCVKNAVVSKDVIFYLFWYNVYAEAEIYEKNLVFFSFYSLLLTFSE